MARFVVFLCCWARFDRTIIFNRFFFIGWRYIFQGCFNNLLKGNIMKKQHSYSTSSYSVYGFASQIKRGHLRLAFCGELLVQQRLYILGNGRRVYVPSLMRFLSPDSMSPFSRGGINAYMYCNGDPVNYSDPSGHMRWRSFKTWRRERKLAKSIIRIDGEIIGLGYAIASVKRANEERDRLINLGPNELSELGAGTSDGEIFRGRAFVERLGGNRIFGSNERRRQLDDTNLFINTMSEKVREHSSRIEGEIEGLSRGFDTSHLSRRLREANEKIRKWDMQSV